MVYLLQLEEIPGWVGDGAAGTVAVGVKFLRRCQRDEWPPQYFWQGDPGQVVRYNHLEDNAGTGSLWKKFCPEHANVRCEPGNQRVDPGKGRQPATTFCKKELTLKGELKKGFAFAVPCLLLCCC